MITLVLVSFLSILVISPTVVYAISDDQLFDLDTESMTRVLEAGKELGLIDDKLDNIIAKCSGYSVVMPCIEFMEEFNKNMKAFFANNKDNIEAILYGN